MTVVPPVASATPSDVSITRTPSAACDADGAKNLGYLSNVGDGSVSVIDLTTHQKVGVIGGFSQPWNLNVTPDGRTLFVDDQPAFELDKTNIATVDTCTGRIVERRPTGGLAIGSMPEYGTELFHALYVKREVEVYDTVDRRVTETYPAQGLPISTLGTEDGRTIWVGGVDYVYRIDRATGRSTESTPIRTSVAPQQLSISPDGKTLAIGAATEIVLIDTEQDRVKKTLTLPNGEFGSAAYGSITEDGKYLWMAYFSGQVVVVDLDTEQIVKVHETGGQAIGTVFSPDHSKVYVSTTPPGSIIAPLGIAYTGLGFADAWKPGGVVRVYDTHTLDQIEEFPAGNLPQAIAIPGVAK
ncbi:YncE family protein [Rhodococcoides corynebacterioides]|uniref:YncE family protein n=1 Tax=Rhodococcoides corynebacterioides TaxID=53972 RepID=UPI003F820AE7